MTPFRFGQAVILSKFGKQIDYKCMCSVGTSLVKLQSELVTVIELVSLHCGERTCYDGCLIIARVAETLTQHERVKPHFDLTGYPKNIEAQKTDVMQALGDVLQVCPSLAKNLTPELRLALCLGGIGVMTASSNRAAQGFWAKCASLPRRLFLYTRCHFFM